MAVTPTNGYCTGDQVKDALGISGTGHDTEIEQAINAASRAIDRWCGQRFWEDSEDTTRYFTADDQSTLNLFDTSGDLNAVSVTSVTSVTLDRSGNGTFGTSWVEDTDYFTGPRGAAASSRPYTSLQALSGRVWPVGVVDGVKVVGTFGWASVPDLVEQACLQLSSRIFKETREAPFGVVVFGDGFDGGTVRTGRLIRQVAGLLDPFRLTMVG